MGPRSPIGRSSFEGEGASHCKLHSAVISAKTGEPIEMPFGCELGWAQGIMCYMGVQTPEVLRDVAMATNFGTLFAVTAGFLSFDGL